MNDGSEDTPERGFFDLQVNGFAGVDFQRTDVPDHEMLHVCDALERHRTSRILLTLITDRIDALCAKLASFERQRERHPRLARMIAGYHIEGPYLSPTPGFHGVHNPTVMKQPSSTEFDLLQEAARGRIRLVTLAPEWPDSAEFIAHITRRHVVASIGHSDASEEQIDAAIGAGLTMCTHLGNGAPPMLHRHDNIVQRLLARDELYAVFIPDGIHVPRATLKNFVRAKPRDKVLFTSDCMAAAGAGPGRFRIGKCEVEVGADGVVREPGRPNFAGSSLTMDRAADNVREFLGWHEPEIARACGWGVAASLGLS